MQTQFTTLSARHVPRLLVLLCALVLAGCAVQVGFGDRSKKFGAMNFVTVWADPGVPGRFEAFHRAGAGPIDYWCAAGDYVINGRRMAPNTRIYLVAGSGPSALQPGKNSIAFTVQPDDALLRAAAALSKTDYSLSLTRPGYSQLAAAVRQNCRPLMFPFSLMGE